MQRRTYRPYGEKIADSTGHVESRGWIDQRQDGETGLTYLHARYYDPATGTFLSPDPIGPEGGLNSYGYAFGDPANLTDRSGLDPDVTFCYPNPNCTGSPGGPSGGGFRWNPGSGGGNPFEAFKDLVAALILTRCREGASRPKLARHNYPARRATARAGDDRRLRMQAHRPTDYRE